MFVAFIGAVVYAVGEFGSIHWATQAGIWLMLAGIVAGVLLKPLASIFFSMMSISSGRFWP